MPERVRAEIEAVPERREPGAGVGGREAARQIGIAQVHDDAGRRRRTDQPRGGECEGAVLRWQMVRARIGDPEQLELRLADRDLAVQRPERNPRVFEARQDELAEVLRIDDVEHLESVRLTPHHLLLAGAQPRRADLALHVQLAQLDRDAITEVHRARERRDVGFTRCAGFEPVERVAAQPADRAELEVGGQVELQRRLEAQLELLRLPVARADGPLDVELRP